MRMLLRTVVQILYEGTKVVLHLLAILLKIVYNIFKLFRMRLLALYLVICALLQLIFQTFSGFAMAYFWVGLCACACVTLVSWALYAREKLKRKQVDSAAKKRRFSQSEPKKEAPPQDKNPAPKVQASVPAYAVQSDAFPKFYEVEGHAGYMFAEYEDRYELFRRDQNGYTYLRTDYKGKLP